MEEVLDMSFDRLLMMMIMMMISYSLCCENKQNPFRIHLKLERKFCEFNSLLDISLESRCNYCKISCSMGLNVSKSFVFNGRFWYFYNSDDHKHHCNTCNALITSSPGSPNLLNGCNIPESNTSAITKTK